MVDVHTLLLLFIIIIYYYYYYLFYAGTRSAHVYHTVSTVG